MYDEALLQVVNPDDEVYCVANSFPAISLVPVVKRILYEVEFERLDDGVTVKVLSELDADGDEDTWTQLLKLSEETWKVPEQSVSELLTVMLLVSITSEKITLIELAGLIMVAPSEGEVEETVGAVVSNLKA